MSFWLFKSFKIVVVKNNAISVSSFFSKKKVLKFSDLEFVGWHSEYFHYSKSFHIVATLYDIHGGSIEINDLELENFDAIMQCVPHENSSSKKRVYKKLAKDGYISSAIGLALSALFFVFMVVSFGGDIQSYFSGNYTLEDFFFRVLFPIVHVLIIWVFLKRTLRYRNIFKKGKSVKKVIAKTNSGRKGKIENSFEYCDDPVMGYFSGSWKIEGQNELAEVYFYAPKDKMLQSQIDNFDKLLANYPTLREELGQALDKRLKLDNHKHLDHLLEQPLHFSIISVLYDQRNHENVQADYDIELIASKLYTSLGIKRAVDIVAVIANGKIKEIIKESDTQENGRL
ncbi:hypothetical protein [Zobellia uliginosa]|uniref:hypothetical protein n=1 Tax=Zobellia uliginosa TaxID=143224 RepID=UPI0026E30C3C|nr:hypothetical protein [Zobellia uliginosa]MDO6519068.1 hypothetical protein [Zobellia uliginosa]